MSWNVLSLGGGVIVPGKIDVRYLSNLRRSILRLVQQGHRFVLICGGGSTCRSYRDAAKEISRPTAEELDRIGIMSTKLNAELVRVIFSKWAYPEVIEPDKKPELITQQIVVASGWKPGRSTDYGATLLAKSFSSKRVYNLTNVDYVYDKDPKHHKDVKPFPEMSWDEFTRFTPKDWSPGMYSPFDPVAARLAKESGMKVIVINGKDLPNLEACLEGRKFKGTVIG